MPSYDILIHGARVIDGTGNPWCYGDVALEGERIAAVAPPGVIAHEHAADVVDATGMVVCPGFIDILSHAILPLMVDGRCLSKITQGITTEIMGEGWTPAPVGGKIDLAKVKQQHLARTIPDWIERMQSWTRFRDWLEAMLESGVSPNIGSFLGGGSLRMYAMGMALGAPSADEMEAMKRVAAEAMGDGAFGVSFALIYPPSAYAETDEIVEICKVISRYGGVYITHLRSEADGLLEAIDEALEIGRRANVPVEIYHLKAAGKGNWNKLDAAIEKIEAARAGGLDVTADMYPYAGAGTGLSSVLPPWASADKGLYENLRDPVLHDKIRAEALQPTGEWEAMVELCGADGVMPIGLFQEENSQYAGRTLAEIADARGQEWVDAAFDLLLSEEQEISTIYFMMDEANVQRKLTLPWNKIATDAGGYDPEWGRKIGPTHPRSYGTFTRVLGKYVREEGVLTLEDAVRKMSSAVANRLGLQDRGLLREGLQADVVVFDPETVADKATYADPHQLSVGVRDVWVNGERVLAGGEHTGATPGQVVSGPGA